MLSFFPRDVLDEIWDLIGRFLRVFLPIFLARGEFIESQPVFNPADFLQNSTTAR